MTGSISSRVMQAFHRSRRFSLSLAAAVSLAAGATPIAAAPRTPAQRTAADELAAFPATMPGQVRRVIMLQPQPNEDALKVGIIIGTTMMVDCNHHVFGSRMAKRTVQGWGYEYFVVTTVNAPASTLMACPPNSQSRRFVRSADEPFLRYNSRLPIVIFAPADVEVRYRVWRAGPEVVARQSGK